MARSILRAGLALAITLFLAACGGGGDDPDLVGPPATDDDRQTTQPVHCPASTPNCAS